MIDYLDLLLELWDGDEKKREALHLEEERAGFSRKNARAGDRNAPMAGHREIAAVDHWESSGADGGKSLAMVSGKPLTPDGAEVPAINSAWDSAMNNGKVRRGAGEASLAVSGREITVLPPAGILRKDAGLSLIGTLRKAAELSLSDVLRTAGRQEKRIGDRRVVFSKAIGTLPLEDLLSLVPSVKAAQAERRSLDLSGNSQSPAAGAAALERRLMEQSLAAATAPERTLFVPESDGIGSISDWDEFDRRLERDARRYDGGMGIY